MIISFQNRVYCCCFDLYRHTEMIAEYMKVHAISLSVCFSSEYPPLEKRCWNVCVSWRRRRWNVLQHTFVVACPFGVALLRCQWGCCTAVQPHYPSRKASNELDEKCPFGKRSMDTDWSVGKWLVVTMGGLVAQKSQIFSRGTQWDMFLDKMDSTMNKRYLLKYNSSTSRVLDAGKEEKTPINCKCPAWSELPCALSRFCYVTFAT